MNGALINNRRLCSSMWRIQPINTFLGSFHHSVDSRNFKKWGRSPTTTQNVGEGLKIVGDDFMIKFKLIKNTFSVYLDIFNWASIN